MGSNGNRASVHRLAKLVGVGVENERPFAQLPMISLRHDDFVLLICGAVRGVRLPAESGKNAHRF